MITSWNDINSFGGHWIIGIMGCVEYQDLICTFSRFTLHIIHETTTKYDDFVIVGHTGVPATSLYAVVGAEVYVLPVGPICTCRQPSNFAITFVILPTNKVTVVVNATKGGVLTRSWGPPLTTNRNNLGIERLSFLHSLNVSL